MRLSFRLLIIICFVCTTKMYGGNLPSYNSSLKQLNIEIPGITIDSVSSVIAFTRAGNLIVVKAKADTTEGNFILDTGAPNLVLNLTYFRDYPTTYITDGEHAGITGSSAAIIKTEVKKFAFASLTYSRVEADVTNLGAIENSKGIKILGLLGVDLFKDCEMIIDYENNLIYLHRINRKEASTYQHAMLKDVAAYSTFPIDITDNRILITTQLAGKNLKFVIDCAAESNILDSRLPNKIFDNVTVTKRVLLSGAGNKKIEALYGDLKTMQVGSITISNLPVLITNLEYTCFAQNGCINGVLGFDFLSLHKTGFNFVNQKMYIWK